MEDRKLSTFSVVSGVIAVGTALVTFLLFVASFIPEDGTYVEQHVDRAFFGFTLAIAPILHVAGLIFGITGLLRSTKKTFAVVAIVLNSVPLLLAIVALVVLLILAILIVLSGPAWR